jgi:uncharacterized protein
MRFNVSGLLQEGIGATRRHQVDDFLRMDSREREQVVGDLEMLRTKDGILVRANLRLVEPEVCSRCLRPLEETVGIAFEEEFLASVDPRTGNRVEDIDPDAFRIDENHILDISEAVRQYRQISLAMQPLCMEECRGLCPNCGKDLNFDSCECERGPVDSRWEGLAALKSAAPEGKD